MFLRKCRRTLRTGVRLLRKRGDRLVERDRVEFEADLRTLDRSLLNKRKQEALESAKRVRLFIKKHFPKSALDQVKEVMGALAFALVVAFLIRQFWFELYEVPTGSMRPTVQELDRLVVSKTTFGLNIPFTEKPLFFSDDLIRRAGIIVFTTKGMDVPDSDMLYFHLFPGKKRFIKRAMGKPGDALYFYGGQVYGVDKEGNGITDLTNPHFLERYGIEKIDHIPYITFDGKMVVGKSISPHVYDSVQLKQMNEKVGEMQLTRTGKIEGKFFYNGEWITDKPDALKAPRENPVSYSDLWGIGNYAMARLLTKEQTQSFYGKAPENGDAELYLELRHTPNFTYPKPEMRRDEQGRIHPMLTPFATVIPLGKSHLEALQKALFTARFFIKDGRAYRYQEGRARPQRYEFDPLFPGVPDGLYEFYYGTGYRVHFGGITTKLPNDHPLYSSDPENIQKLFNLGLGFNLVFEPMAANQPYNPQRFAYYRDGDLYVMGAPILKSSDPTLIRFTQSELEKQKNSGREAPYIAFVDHGPPLKDGEIDKEFIQAFGLKIPENGVLALGDNYAMSADSRDFGFVPTENLRGSPSFTFWPPGKRLGPPPQPPYPWITPTNLIVGSLVFLIAAALWIYIARRNKTSYFD